MSMVQLLAMDMMVIGGDDGRDGEVDELDNLVQSPGQVDRGGSRCPKQTFCLFNVHTKSLNHMLYMAHTPW